MSEQELLYHVTNRVAFLTINRESKRNSISPEVTRLFHRYLAEAESDPNVRVVCLSGAGEKAFCSGADLGGGVGPEGLAAFQEYAELLKRISRYPKPTVARVNGYCLAGGTGFMLACDIVVAAEHAKFGTPEVNVGLFPLMIGALIFRNVLRKKAMEMCLLGEKLTAQQALELGLVTRVVPANRLDEEVNAILNNLTGKSPIGMKIGKEAFYQTADLPFEQALDYLAGQLGVIAATEDAKEGIMAFLEKRQPNFTGK